MMGSDALKNLPVPMLSTGNSLETVLSASGKAFMGIYNSHADKRDAETLRDGIVQAERFLADCEVVADSLREAVEPQAGEVIRQQVETFVGAWPLASDVDLSIYTAQLVADITERQPCHFGLRAGLRHVRHTARALPSIAEVVQAVDEAQKRVHNTAWHLGHLPAELEKARAELVKAEAHEAAFPPHRWPGDEL